MGILVGTLEGIMFKNWYNVMHSQMTTLMTVRCLRESNNLKLLLGCLNDAVQLCFAGWTVFIIPDGYLSSFMILNC